MIGHNTGCVCIQVYAIEYHLAPEFKFPYQLLEVEAVLTWLAKNGKDRGVDPSRICIGKSPLAVLLIMPAFPSNQKLVFF